MQRKLMQRTTFGIPLLWGLLCLVEPASALASCGVIDKAQNLPVYDQGTTEMCYSYASVLAFDAMRSARGQKVPPRTSPSELGFRYTQKNPGTWKWQDVQYGSPGDVLRILSREGGCPYLGENDVEMDRGGQRWQEFERLADIRSDYHKQQERIEGGKSRAGFFTRKTPRQAQEALVQEIACGMPAPDANGSLEGWMRQVEEALKAPRTIDFLQKLYASRCQNSKLQVPGLKVRVESIQSAQDPSQRARMKSSVDRALDASPGTLPVISYCPDVLTYRRADEIEYVSKEKHFGCRSSGSHASVITGRRQGRNGCEYRVRNSWGTSCLPYVYPCKNGEIWVPENELFSNTLGVQWLE